MGRIVGLVFEDEPTAKAKPRKKADIQAYLTELGIDFPEDATVDELKALMPDDDDEE